MKDGKFVCEETEDHRCGSSDSVSKDPATQASSVSTAGSTNSSLFFFLGQILMGNFEFWGAVIYVSPLVQLLICCSL